MTVDGSLVDIASIMAAVGVGLHRPFRHRWSCGTWRCRMGDMIADALSGSSIVPFVVLIGTVFSSTILQAALQTSKVYMAIGGVIGVIVLLAEIARPKAVPEAHRP